uniref:Acid tail salivary protein n=1 Tax=Ornithodoros coriaceus TaxID=92741 RepID=B2D2C8_ORNCO|nr:acid tail salivary protein [Ornithodoros coriaceus]
MKAAILLALASLALVAGQEYPCERKNRPSGQKDCSYYCQLNGKWELGKYQNNIPCDYSSSNDGICLEGLCYNKDTVKPGSNPGGRNQPADEGGDEEWDRK